MATIFQWIAKFLLIPLIKDLVVYVKKEVEKRAEIKRLKDENAKKGEAYANAATKDEVKQTFEELP